MAASIKRDLCFLTQHESIYLAKAFQIICVFKSEY